MASAKKSGAATGYSASAKATTKAVSTLPEADEVEVEIEADAGFPVMESVEASEVLAVAAVDETDDVELEVDDDDIEAELGADEAELEEIELGADETLLTVETQQDLPIASSAGTPVALSSRRRSSAARVAYQ